MLALDPDLVLAFPGEKGTADMVQRARENGFVVEEGRKRGIPTPANEILVEVTRRIYVGELKPDPSNLNVAMELLKSKMQGAYP
jgi:hypothetical protein